MRLAVTLALGSLLLAACAGRPASDTTPAANDVAASPAPTSTPAPNADTLGLAPLAIYFDGVMVLQLHADGMVHFRSFDKPGPLLPLFKIAPDGTIDAFAGGQGRLRPDGRMITPRGDVSRFQLVGDTLTLGGRHLTLDADGVLQLDGPAIAGTPPRVEGVVDRASRRTAMLLLGMVLDAGLSPSR